MSILKKVLKFGFLLIIAATLGLFASHILQSNIPEEVRGADDPQKAAIDWVVKFAVKGLGEFYKGKSGPVRRDAHAKSHGCIKAVLKVDPEIPSDLKVGLFKEPGKARKAWIRFSNGAFPPRPDKNFDGRGMALKILDADPAESTPQKNVDQYDFLMINHPAFFSSGPVDYLDFVKAGALAGQPGSAERFLFPGSNPFNWRLRGAWIGYQISRKPIESPLKMQYFTMTPYAFEEGRSVKYSSRPCKSSLESASVTVDTEDPNYLRRALQRELKNRSACFEFLVQLNDGSFPIDDARVKWSEKISPFRRVAFIEIASQDFSTPNQEIYCENTDFHPGRTLKGFEGLGGLNKMREALYTAISNFRHQKNNAEVPDPNLAWNAQ